MANPFAVSALKSTLSVMVIVAFVGTDKRVVVGFWLFREVSSNFSLYSQLSFSNGEVILSISQWQTQLLCIVLGFDAFTLPCQSTNPSVPVEIIGGTLQEISSTESEVMRSGINLDTCAFSVLNGLYGANKHSLDKSIAITSIHRTPIPKNPLLCGCTDAKLSPTRIPGAGVVKKLSSRRISYLGNTNGNGGDAIGSSGVGAAACSAMRASMDVDIGADSSVLNASVSPTEGTWSIASTSEESTRARGLTSSSIPSLVGSQSAVGEESVGRGWSPRVTLNQCGQVIRRIVGATRSLHTINQVCGALRGGVWESWCGGVGGRCEVSGGRRLGMVGFSIRNALEGGRIGVVVGVEWGGGGGVELVGWRVVGVGGRVVGHGVGWWGVGSVCGEGSVGLVCGVRGWVGSGRYWAGGLGVVVGVV
ncbi:hypothetical protein Tco_0247644 [Tanacetum coccineum]